MELVVGLMAKELVERGHEVTVFAPGDSTVRADLVSLLPTGYHHDESVWDWQLAEFMQLGLAYERADEFDVINSHVYCYALPFSRLVDVPTVHTFHICPTPDFMRYCAMFPEAHTVALTEFQRRLFRDLPVAATIPNGIDTERYPFRPESGTYLLFLGDIRPDKGPLDAVAIARKAGMPLVIAGPENRYFHDVVKPEIDGHAVEYVGEVDEMEKPQLIGGATALLFLSNGLEACPLVLLESMACGTPVAALRRGPVPEMVADGTSGLLAQDLGGLADSLSRIEGLDRGRVRAWAAERFDASRMAADYIRLFERLVELPEGTSGGRP